MEFSIILFRFLIIVFSILNLVSSWNSSTIRSTLLPGINKILIDLDSNLSECGSGVYTFDIRELTIVEAHRKFSSSELSCEELTKCYLKRIEALNPYLKAIIEINPDALDQARKIDVGGFNSSLLSLRGIPVLIKDNMATLDKMQTTAGALAMVDVKPNRDSMVVSKLREAGAVILGKSNPAEWAFWRGENVPPGWSGRGGQTINPYILTKDPSESSTGSAVGTATNLALVSLGTETDGSIITPSSVGSLVGLKPTVGCVSTEGVIPIAFTQDTVGPITRTVSDALIVFNSIANEDCKVHVDSLKNRERLKVGVLRKPYWNPEDPLLKKHLPSLEIALRQLQNSENITIIDPVEGDAVKFAKVGAEDELIVLTHEFKWGINDYLENFTTHLETSKIHSLADIIAFNEAHPSPQGYDQNLLLASQTTDGIQNQTYLLAKEKNRKFAREYLDEIFFSHGKLDAISSPCYADHMDVLNVMNLLYSMGAIAGYPHITIPTGVDVDGYPIGICFLGRQHGEETLIRIGNVLEKVNYGRSMPKFKVD